MFIEHKLRAAHAVLAVWRDTKVKAHKEGKDPVIVLSEKGRHGQWLLFHEADMPAVAANWLATLEDEDVSDLLAQRARYRREDQDQGEPTP